MEEKGRGWLCVLSVYVIRGDRLSCGSVRLKGRHGGFFFFFSRWSGNTPGDLKEKKERFLSKSLLCCFPVHDVPDCGEIFCFAVLVLQAVEVF